MIEYILKNIFSIFGKENVNLIIFYGNEQGKDIDVFVVIAGESEYNCTQQGRFDITYVGEKWLTEMIEFFDPLLTEPILTGKTIYGNSSHIKNALSKIRPSRNMINYLKNKAFLYFQWAYAHCCNNDLTYASDCIRFSLGFYYFALYYQCNDEIITYSDLTDKFINEYQMIETAKKMANNKKELTLEKVWQVLTEAHDILTKG